jgi:hypothetical protein
MAHPHIVVHTRSIRSGWCGARLQLQCTSYRPVHGRRLHNSYLRYFVGISLIRMTYQVTDEQHEVYRLAEKGLMRPRLRPCLWSDHHGFNPVKSLIKVYTEGSSQAPRVRSEKSCCIPAWSKFTGSGKATGTIRLIEGVCPARRLMCRSQKRALCRALLRNLFATGETNEPFAKGNIGCCHARSNPQ